MENDRRKFLAFSSKLATLAAFAGTAPAGSAAVAAVNPNQFPFGLGVASGSPLPTSVVLWTRILANPVSPDPLSNLAYSVRWEVADDDSFRHIVAKGTASALPSLAHSVHVDVTGLTPGRWYSYRFMLGDAVSPVGRTRTAPRADSQVDLLKMAVASCQHWEFGQYGAHRHIALANPDVVAFVGDYIYEWGPFDDKHPLPEQARHTNTSTTLDSYRRRYAQYKSDPLLQQAHHVAPWIVTWDDHEVANDYANDHDYALSPTFLERRAAAYQAFYEHMPVRLPTLDNGPLRYASMRIYERYDWGRLARLHVLDDRQYRSYQVCPKEGHGGSNSVTESCTARRDPQRTLLGQTQEAWLRAGLSQSPARWNILTQQTLMAQNSSSALIKPGDGRFWTDGWDGYPDARQRLFDDLVKYKVSNPVVLSGDVHTFYATDLKRDFRAATSDANPVIASEFCGTSVTSSSRPQERTEHNMTFNPHIHYGRSDTRGFMLVEVTPKKTTSHFQGLDDVTRADSGLRTVASFVVEDGRPGINQI